VARTDVKVAAFSALAGPLLRGALDLFLPRACVACEGPMDGEEPGIVCGRCWTRLVLLPAPRCERCGHPRRRGECRWCDLLPPFVRAVRSVCWLPAGTAGPIVHALKYDGWTATASGMAERMARLSWPADVMAERTALIPVPLSRSRERERGFNQSALLATALAPRWGIPVWPQMLERARATQTQTRLTPAERSSNVAGAFRATEGAHSTLRGAHVVLVDDVVTTAATLNACADVLFAAGARILSYVTFGRAPASGDRTGQ
jgi:ComF family protein